MGWFDHGGLRGSFVWHRRAGKDRCFLAQASKAAHRRVGLYWHMLPTLRQARKVVWDNITRDGQPLIRTTFPEELVARDGYNISEMKITLKNGSIVQLVGSDTYNANIGANPVGVTFSEWATTDPLAWEYVRPILRENGGWAAFISTPRGYNHCHTLHQMALKSPAWMADTQTIDDTGIMSRVQYETELAEGMPEELARQEYLCDFSAANVGAVLGRWIEQVEREGRIELGLADEMPDRLVVSCDIGRRDAAAWWYWKPVIGGFLLVDYDEDSGLDADAWVDRIKAKCYDIETIWFPHDGTTRTFAARNSAVEIFVDAKIARSIRVVPKTAVKDRINAARAVMKRCRFDDERTERGRQILREWSFHWDEERKVFSEEPEHNYASHGGDAFSYGAQVLLEERPPAAAAPRIKGVYELTYNELIEAEKKYSGRRARI